MAKAVDGLLRADHPKFKRGWSVFTPMSARSTPTPRPASAAEEKPSQPESPPPEKPEAEDK